MKLNNIAVYEDSSNTSIFIANQIVDIYSEVFPFISDMDIKIILEPNGENPYCSYDKSYILLAVEPTHWAQLAYQLSHELLHFIIPKIIPNNYTNHWFEEALAEMMSQYVLPRLTKSWANNPLSSINFEYGEFFSKYIENQNKYTEAFDINLLDQHDSEILKSFQSDPYQREKLRHIASKMLPVFESNPSLWYAIQYLHFIPNDLTLSEIFDSLSEKCLLAKTALEKLRLILIEI